MSVIPFQCNACGGQFRLNKPELAGKKIRCPKCKAVCQLPQLPEVTEKKPEPLPRSAAKEEVDSRENTKAKPESRSGVVPVVVALVVVAYAAAVVGTSLRYWNLTGYDMTQPAWNTTGRGRGPNPSEAGAAGDRGSLPVRDAEQEAKLEAERAERLTTLRQTEQELIEAMQNSPAAEKTFRGELVVMGQHESDVTAIAFSPTSEFLATGSIDKTIVLWDLRTTTAQRVLKGHVERVTKLAISPDGKTLASASANGTVRLWNLETGKNTKTYSNTKVWIRSFSFSPDGTRLAIGAEKRNFRRDPSVSTLVVRNLTTGQLIYANREDRTVTRAEFRPQGDELVVLYEESLGIIDLETKTKTEIDLDKTYSFSLSPDGWEAAIPAKDNRLLNLETGKDKPVPFASSENRAHLWYAPEGDLLRFEKDRLYRYPRAGGDVQEGPLQRISSFPHFSLSPGGVFLASDWGPRVSIWVLADILEGDPEAVIKEIKPFAQVRSEGRMYEVSVNSTITDEQLGKLRKLPRVSELSIYDRDGGRLTDASLAFIAGMKDVTELHIYGDLDEVTADGLAHIGTMTQLRQLRLSDLAKIGDDDLVHLSGLTKLNSLALKGSRITGKALAPLEAMSELTTFSLARSLLTDDGVEGISKLPHLETLYLRENAKLTGTGLVQLAKRNVVKLDVSGSGLTDEGFQAVGQLSSLESLRIDETEITDEALKVLASLPKLSHLSLDNTKNITGTGLKHCSKLTELTSLDLGASEVTDEGMVGVKDLVQLTELSIPFHATDKALVHLEKLTNLEELDVARDGIKGFGLKHLEPLKNVVELRLYDSKLTDEGLVGVQNLTQVESLSLPDTLSDASFVHLSKLVNLRSLRIPNHKGFTGAGLKHLKGITAKTIWNLDRMPHLTDEGLASLAEWKHLEDLVLPEQITDATLAHLKDLPNLESLEISNCPITDAGLKHLAGLPKLKMLFINDTPITDAGLKHLREMPSLVEVEAERTKITEVGKKDFESALPNVKRTVLLK